MKHEGRRRWQYDERVARDEQLDRGKMYYSCYRLKDVDAVDHSGNREELGRWFGTKEAAQVVADQMNKGELS